MIHHVSIPASDPHHVAEVLAELMGGKCRPFGPLEGAFMATGGDAHGTMIEVYPERATLDIPPNDDQVVFGKNTAPPQTWPFHMLLSVAREPGRDRGHRGARGLACKDLRPRHAGAKAVFSRDRILGRKPLYGRGRVPGNGAGI